MRIKESVILKFVKAFGIENIDTERDCDVSSYGVYALGVKKKKVVIDFMKGMITVIPEETGEIQKIELTENGLPINCETSETDAVEYFKSLTKE